MNEVLTSGLTILKPNIKAALKSFSPEFKNSLEFKSLDFCASFCDLVLILGVKSFLGLIDINEDRDERVFDEEDDELFVVFFIDCF